MPGTAFKKAIGAENFYTREQLIEFLSCIKRESNHKAYALFRFAFSGMRKGEVLTLTWNDTKARLFSAGLQYNATCEYRC